MDRTSAKKFMTDFFEKYYDRLYSEDEFFVTLPGVPENMIADKQGGSDGGWRVWKLVPSSVTEQELSALEADFGVKFPDAVKEFLSVYHHLFDNPIGRNSTDKKFYGIKQAFNPHLTANDYLPISWDEEHYFIR